MALTERWRLRRALVVILLALLIASAVGAASAAGAHAETQLQANKVAARRDARQLLTRLPLPKDLTRIGSAPRWAIQAAALAGTGEISAANEAWWTTTASPQAIIDFLKAHRPAGAADDGTGSEHNFQTGVNNLNVEFSWPPVGLQLYDRSLTVTIVTPPHGDSVVVAQSESSWIVPRPASELVPRRAQVVDVRLRIGHGLGGSRHMRTSTYVVWRQARVTEIVRQFNALQTVQDGAVMAGCTLMLPNRPYLTLTFRSGRGPGHPVLAHAKVFVNPGSQGASGRNSCDPIVFWIGSREEPMLTSPTFVRWLGKLIGANIS